MASFKVAFVVLMCLAVVGAPITQAAVNCGTVTTNLAGCLTYLQQGGTPSPGCCNGVKSVLASAQTTPDRQAVCNCLKSAAGGIPGLNPQNAESLPGKCGVNIPYKISTSTNCASIKF